MFVIVFGQDGKVYAWGGNEYLQCGVDGEEKNIVSPTICVPHLKVIQVACGGMHSLALTADGEVWTWGEPWGEFKLEKEKNPRPVKGATNIQQVRQPGWREHIVFFILTI